MFNRIVVFFRIKQILFILLLSISNISFSQSFNAGILTGINASQISGDGYQGFNKAGLLIGAYTNIDISEKVNLQLELNYSQKGSRDNILPSEGDTDFFLLRLNYIEIPVLARFKYKKFIFEGGLYYAQLISEYLEDENGPFEIPEELNQFKNFDFGGSIGIYFSLTENLLMNWRFSNSITNVRDYDSGENFRFNTGMFNTYMSFTLRYEIYGEGK